MSDKTLEQALEDAIWQALDAEQGMPHSGVDPGYVIPDVVARLKADGYLVVKLPTDDELEHALANEGVRIHDRVSDIVGDWRISHTSFEGATTPMDPHGARGLAVALFAAAEKVDPS